MSFDKPFTYLKMKPIHLAIRDFALPVPRTGSIEANSGMGRALEEGQEIHLRVQNNRAEFHSNYQAEVQISQSFEKEGYQFEVSGRMDGLFEQDPPKIEEIKTSFNIRDLYQKLSSQPSSHPYCLQLKTYGYFYWLKHQKVPELQFYLVSSRNKDSEYLKLPFDIPEYENWLNTRLDELVKEAKKIEKRILRRQKMAESISFPFESPRPGQVDLVQTIENGMGSQCQMLIQAPTGLGKTVGVLYPTLKDALHRGQNVVYVTPKNSQHTVAEDAVTQFQETGTAVKSLTITAKSKICFKNEPLCNPEYCEYAKDHYTKVYENKILESLERKKKLTSKVFREIGEEFQVCPFELQLNAASQADVIICDYNYVFSPNSALAQLNSTNSNEIGKPNLVIDEAHNLPSRAMDYYSPALSSYFLENMREEIRKLPPRFEQQAEELLDDCVEAILSCKPDGDSKSSKITPETEKFLEIDAKLRQFLSQYLESDVEIEPGNVVLRLCFYWSDFAGALEFVANPKRTEFFTTFHSHPSGGTIKITCCDASDMLKESYKEYNQVVAFSATLKPFEYYARLSGLKIEDLKISEFLSPFPKSNRKLLIIPQISTKYSDRERNYAKIAEAIHRISSVRSGNYLAFFPSFEFLERVLEQFKAPDGFTIIKQEKQLKKAEIDAILDHLRLKNQPTLLFAVQGGVFSEGVDYPGEMVIGAFVVGPPLPSFDIEREEMKKYYDRNYKKGFDYAYTYPAMAKAVQAAGRVIRSEKDKGLIVLMDERFIHSSYTQSMPTDWFEENAKELVSDQILKEVRDFWNRVTY